MRPESFDPLLAETHEVVEAASSADEVVAALGAYADEGGNELARQVFPPELRSPAGVASLAFELTRLGMRHGLDDDGDWNQLETLFARAAVRLSELEHPAARSGDLRPRRPESTRTPPRAPPR